MQLCIVLDALDDQLTTPPVTLRIASSLVLA